MRSTIALTTLTAVGLLGLTPANGQSDNNGFPSGPHYNLNILAKKDGYNCVPVATDPLTGLPIYGNVVFVPESGVGIEIEMISGKSGGKASQITQLQVIDACAGFDGTPAQLKLPPNAAGYKVYARALAKPNEMPMKIEPALVAVEDEYGNNLIELGFVSSSGFFNSNSETFQRFTGKSVARDITGLFQWTGEVCTYAAGSEGAGTQMCWVDSQLEGEPGHGVVDSGDTFSLPVDGVCTQGVLTWVTYTCTQYSGDWVFNIGELVTYLWDIDNSGLKHLQVRFYPQ